MRTSILEWIKTLQQLKEKGVNIIHRSAFDSLYKGKKSSLRTIIYRLEKRD